MKIIRSIAQMQKLSRQLAAKGKRIALVPTMGYLHEGHLSLIRKGKQKADIVITTIFVNPTQFGPRDDLTKYPRDEKGDIKKISKAGGDIVFMPKASDIYPKDFQTWVSVEQLTQTLEGAARPGHFRGVTTIVAKFFTITRPDVVLFGMKDYQQAMVLRRMTYDLGFPIQFIIAPTVREKDGLAMSSRNSYFTPEQRKDAICLYRALQTAKAMVKSGEKRSGEIGTKMRHTIYSICPIADIEYIAFTDMNSLTVQTKIEKNTICSLAVRVHGVRLIDNMKLM